MNKKNITKLINHMEMISSDEYDQSVYYSETERCRTPCCLAGHAVCLFINESMDDVLKHMTENDLEVEYQHSTDKKYLLEYLAQRFQISRFARHWLDLDFRQVYPLFVAAPQYIGGPRNPSPAQAVKVLKHLKATGEVNWQKGNEP